jgi:ubiquinone/menaquinone biosynthesis C-methylase UbiE
MSDYQEFEKAEQNGWADPERASGYVVHFTRVADQAIESLLDAVGAKRNLKALDLCCGHGNVSAALVARGCDVVGADFSPEMLAIARKRVAGARFMEADAQDLPFQNEEFDIVVSSLGVCHVADQPSALKEVHRVLRPGGRFAMTVWCGPEKSPCQEIVYDAIQNFGSPDVTAPPAPDFFQFADRDISERLFGQAGFKEVDMAIVDCVWNLDSPDQLATIYEQGTVRAAMLLAKQPEENLAAIRANLEQTVRERFADGDCWRVPVPAALIWGVA